MRSRAVIALAVVVCVGVCLTGFGLAAKIGSARVQVLKAPSKTDLVSLGPQPEPPDFPVTTISQLRGLQTGLVRVQVRRPAAGDLPRLPRSVQAVEPNLGNPAYSEGSGVVLDVMHPYHEASGSTLVVRGVAWNERVRREVLAADPNTSFVIGVHTARQLIANAYFSQLPSAAHTYMLTIGTSANTSQTRVRIGGSFLSPSELVASPATSEVRALFTYEAGGDDNRVMVLVQVSPSDPVNGVLISFPHVQLAQVD